MAKQLAEELGIPIMFKLNYMNSYVPVHDQLIREETGLDCITRSEYLEKNRLPYLNDDCLQMFCDPQFNYDGTLLGCCRSKKNYYDANLFRDGLKDALNAPKFVRAKEFLLLSEPDQSYSDLPCWKCNIRKGRAKYKKPIQLPARRPL